MDVVACPPGFDTCLVTTPLFHMTLESNWLGRVPVFSFCLLDEPRRKGEYRWGVWRSQLCAVPPLPAGSLLEQQHGHEDHYQLLQERPLYKLQLFHVLASALLGQSTKLWGSAPFARSSIAICDVENVNIYFSLLQFIVFTLCRLVGPFFLANKLNCEHGVIFFDFDWT